MTTHAAGNQVAGKEAAPVLAVVQANQLYQDPELSVNNIVFIDKMLK
jgi:hypothetical protein